MKKEISLKNENGQVLFNVASLVIRYGINFLTLPIFTRLLGTEQYGKFSLYAAWGGILTCIVGLGVYAGIATGYYRFRERYYEYKSSSLLEGLVLSGLLFVIGIVFINPLSNLVGFSYAVTVSLMLGAGADFIISLETTSLVYEKKAQINTVISIVQLGSTVMISWLLLTFFSDYLAENYYAMIIGTTIPKLIISIVIIPIIFKRAKAVISKEYWSYNIKFGIPNVFHLLAGTVLAQSDRIMMEGMGVSASDVGVYSFIYNLVMVLSSVLMALNNSWVPFFYDDLAKKDYARLEKKVTNYAELFTVLTCGFILVAREMIIIIADESFWGGAYLVPVLAVSVYAIFMYQFSVNYEGFSEKPIYNAIGTIFAALLNIVLNIVFIDRYGMIGAAIATLLGYIALAIFHYLIVHNWKYDKYPLRSKSIIIGMTLTIITSVIYYVLAENWLIRWGIAAIIGVYIIVRIIKRKAIF